MSCSRTQHSEDSKMSTLAKSEDPDEMPHNATFHHSLHCLLGRKGSSEKEIQLYLEIIACDPLIYTMDQAKFTVFNQKEESISA